MFGKKVYFVSGIDTDTGKTVVTGLLAREIAATGRRVITQKFIQTGCVGISEDILAHRELMGTGLFPEDQDSTTCPIVLPYPASAQLAAELAGILIDLRLIENSTDVLTSRYDLVLLEGAGGLCVPLTDDYSTLDYIREQDLPVILVTTPRLGSINHTVLSLDACRTRGISVDYVIYNRYPEAPREILDDTRRYLKGYLDVHFPACEWLEVSPKPALEGFR